MFEEGVNRCKWMLGAGCIIALFVCISIIVNRFVFDSPERETKRLEHEISVSLPAEATTEEVAAWLSSREMTPVIYRSDDGRVISVHGELHRDYAFYWDGDMQFHFDIGKTGSVSSYSVKWHHLGP